MTKWTLVQHSGFVVDGKHDFESAVQVRGISQKSVDLVRNVGGLLFENYMQASVAEYDENYPPSLGGMIPHVDGSFSNEEIEGQRIYIPFNNDE